MIPTSKPQVTSNLDQLESQEFSMLVGEKAFSILVDSLYTDKVLAAVRELCTNAVDAHVMAGRSDQPFTVTLPTYLENTFSVRDYGCSMDHRTIMDLYSKLFWSPKDTTNTQVGYLGLGSKAPLAYTDSFSVIAYLDGIRRDYLVGLNHERIPTITKVNEIAASEPDGLEVSFPVKMGDSDLFERAAKKVFVGLDVKPECNVEIDSPEPELEFENWKIYPSQTGAYGNKFFIKQGCVLYPVEFSSHIMKHYSSNMMVIEVPIGSVEVATSREALSLDDRTKDFIQQLAKDLNCSVQRYINDQLATQKNSIDAAIFLYTKIQPVFDESYTKSLELKYNDKTLDRYIRFGLTVPFEYLDSGKTWTTRKEVALDVGHLSTIKFIIQKTDQKVQRRKARLKEYIKDQPRGVQVYFLNAPSNKDISRLLRFHILPKNIIPIEKIPDTEHTSTGTRSVSKTGVYQYSDDNDHHEIVENMRDDFVWIPINRKNGEFTVLRRTSKILPSEKYNVHTYSAFINAANRLGITKKPIYHLNPMIQKRLEVDDSNKMDTIITEWFNDNIENIKIAYFMDAFSGDYYFKKIISGKIVTEDYTQWIQGKTFRDLSSFVRRYLYENLTGWDAEIDIKREEMNDKYPMLTSPRTEEQMSAYVEMVDKYESGKNV